MSSAAGRVRSVNLGVPRNDLWKSGKLTGIDKRPVLGPVWVDVPGPKGTGEVGLAGDRVYDLKHHGGPDQAVYAYAREVLDRWADELGRPLADGVFGENLTTEGLDVDGALIGERWLVGATLLLEVSVPRIPCGTFQGWLGEVGWVKRFNVAALPGAYLRVIVPGPVEADDQISVVSRPDHEVTMSLAHRAMTLERRLLPQLLAAGDALPAGLHADLLEKFG